MQSINLKRLLKSVIKEKKKKHFNINLVMSEEDEKRFQSSNKCWICNKLFDAGDNEVEIGKYEKENRKI